MPLLLLLGIVAACGSGGDSSAGTTATDVMSIADIQGSGTSSPLIDQDVIVEGIVSGDFQEGDNDHGRNLGGFYLQGASDDDPATSDGVFVYDGNAPATDVEPGDRVRVTGKVQEYYGETQVVASDVTVIGQGTVLPAPVYLPLSTTSNSDGELIVDLEPYEGMLVTFPQALTVSQLRNLERYGEILLSQGGRQYAYTNSNVPDVSGYAAHLDKIAGRRIYLDDGLRTNNAGAPLSIRNGDEVRDLTGVLRYSRGSGDSGTEAYRLMPTATPRFAVVNPRPGAPEVAGSLRIATFNLNNYFSTVDSGQNVCGPARNAVCRGADSEEELSRQLAKIATALRMMDAHVVAMIELENNDDTSLESIADALNAAIGELRYDFIRTGIIGHQAIKVGLIFQPSHVSPAGEFAVLDSGVDARFDDSRHRPVLAQSFNTAVGAHRFTIVVNHLKSKGSGCASAGDPDVGDGQEDCSATRTLGAAAMIDWIDTDPTGAGNDNVIVIGDFNTHTMGDPLARFEAAGYINLAEAHIGTSAYSFEFEGQFGALDHAMATPEFAQKVVDVMEWRINADEARVHDYNLEFGRDASIFNASSPHRVSDHDPLIIGVDF